MDFVLNIIYFASRHITDTNLHINILINTMNSVNKYLGEPKKKNNMPSFSVCGFSLTHIFVINFFVCSA